MKRSEINTILRSADAFIRSRGFHLPPFAYWTPDDWSHKGPEVREIVENKLGWDITDFGKGNFAHTGLFLFTVRNGSARGLAQPASGKLYAEKIMIVEEYQVTPMHFHWSKDRRHHQPRRRASGHSGLQCHPRRRPGPDTPVTVSLDGVEHVCRPAAAAPAPGRKRHPGALQLSQLLGRRRAHPGRRGLRGQR